MSDPTTTENLEKVDPNYLDLPDDEFMNLPQQPVPEAATQTSPPEPVEKETTEGDDSNADGLPQGDGAAVAADGKDGKAAVVDEAGDDETGEGKKIPDPKDPVTPPAKDDASKEAAIVDANKDKTKAPASDKPVVTEVAAPKALTSYTLEEKAAAFDQLMAPFKANGRQVELKSVEELDTLRKMGANFTKKMQALQPHLRATKMLENNNLLDENKLAFAIDLLQGKPLAIQKLLADTQFDPMSIDKDQATDYKPGNHQVSDIEMAFQAALDDVEATPTGKDLINEVAGQWDGKSKEVLFQDPELLRTLNHQREIGLYQVITDEMGRLQTLGQIPQGTPFLQQYRAVGDMLKAQGKLGPKQAAPQVQEQQPVETRVAVPPAQVTNSAKAKAAAPTKQATNTAPKQEENVLGMSDEDFLKQMQGRL